MAKKSRRIAKRLADRQAGYTGASPNPNIQNGAKRPGSKNAAKAS